MSELFEFLKTKRAIGYFTITIIFLAFLSVPNADKVKIAEAFFGAVVEVNEASIIEAIRNNPENVSAAILDQKLDPGWNSPWQTVKGYTYIVSQVNVSGTIYAVLQNGTNGIMADFDNHHGKLLRRLTDNFLTAGDSVLIKEGQYQLGSFTLQLIEDGTDRYKGVSIIGESRGPNPAGAYEGGVELRTNLTGTSVINLQGAGNGANDRLDKVTIKNIFILGVTSSTVPAVIFNFTDYLKAESIWTRNTYAEAFWIEGPQWSEFRYLTAANIRTVGFYIFRSSGAVAQNAFYNCLSGPASGVANTTGWLLFNTWVGGNPIRSFTWYDTHHEDKIANSINGTFVRIAAGGGGISAASLTWINTHLEVARGWDIIGRSDDINIIDGSLSGWNYAPVEGYIVSKHSQSDITLQNAHIIDNPTGPDILNTAGMFRVTQNTELNLITGDVDNIHVYENYGYFWNDQGYVATASHGDWIAHDISSDAGNSKDDFTWSVEPLINTIDGEPWTAYVNDYNSTHWQVAIYWLNSTAMTATGPISWEIEVDWDT